jgi:DNA-binding NarL/FixJ family response regulator
MAKIRDGREFVSEAVQRRLDMRSYYPEPSGSLTNRQIEITRLIANGFTGLEICKVLGISERSVDTRKNEIYKALNVRNENEVIRVAIYLGIIDPYELNFFCINYVLKPLPTKNQRPC